MRQRTLWLELEFRIPWESGRSKDAEPDAGRREGAGDHPDWSPPHVAALSPLESIRGSQSQKGAPGRPICELVNPFQQPRVSVLYRPAGFLGAGKTTLLNHILNTEHGMKFAIIENESRGLIASLVRNMSQSVQQYRKASSLLRLSQMEFEWTTAVLLVS